MLVLGFGFWLFFGCVWGCVWFWGFCLLGGFGFFPLVGFSKPGHV